jgi:hypothetical protein
LKLILKIFELMVQNLKLIFPSKPLSYVSFIVNPDYSDWEDIEEALRGQIKKLKEVISIKEIDREKVRDSMEVEKALRGRIKQLKKKNLEMVRPNGETERRT